MILLTLFKKHTTSIIGGVILIALLGGLYLRINYLNKEIVLAHELANKYELNFKSAIKANENLNENIKKLNKNYELSLKTISRLNSNYEELKLKTDGVKQEIRKTKDEKIADGINRAVSFISNSLWEQRTSKDRDNTSEITSSTLKTSRGTLSDDKLIK